MVMSEMEADMTPDQLQARTKTFTVNVISLVADLPPSIAGRKLGEQLFRSGTSVSANYRAARRGRSKREFIAKICIVVEEADESAHWLELMTAAAVLPEKRINPLHQEATELTRIFASMRRTATENS